MPRLTRISRRAALLVALIFPCVARADEATILSDLAAYFANNDRQSRESIVERIQSDAAFDRKRLSEWLHQAVAFPALPAGESHLPITLENGETRDVLIRAPREYDPARPWPMIYALHGQGGNAANIVRFVEALLGEEVEKFVVAAPDAYQEVVIHHAHWPPLKEHATILDALRHRVHVKADRVYALGYSRGGHTSWTLAVMNSDEFAVVIPLAGTFLMAEVDRLWEHMLPNIRNTSVLCVWGADDAFDDAGKRSDDGGIAGLDRKLRDTCERLKLPARLIELPDIGHGGVRPPEAELREMFSKSRVSYPQSVRITFRDISQARCYWIEGHEWKGPQWTDKPPNVSFQSGESPDKPEDVHAAFTRAFRGLLGELRGEIKGQEIDVYRKNVGDLTVWLSDDLIDFSQPVQLTVNGRKAFNGAITPDIGVCLAQAAQTYDFDRLRWAGLFFDAGGKTKPISAKPDSKSKPPIKNNKTPNDGRKSKPGKP